MHINSESYMKIQSISNIYNPFKYKSCSNKTSLNAVSDKSIPMGDVISFSAKNYSIDDIINPTNHCAYCGCKVYTKEQLESIAVKMLSSKGVRLEGDIKSVLEKLDSAMHSQEIETAKNMENEDEIEFFKKFLEISSKKSWLKGKAIFEQVYGVDEDEAAKLLTKNMHPLLKTIDHVSPQNEAMVNMNSDINLVEACYCCNHDLKKGSSFDEFYAMFPSIKNNMPKEKFEYAYSHLLGSSKEVVSQRISASNMLRLLERLFVQKKEAVNYLDSVNFRINGCKTGIVDAIQSCRDEISEKELKITDLQNEIAELEKDPEYVAILKRVNINSQIDSANNTITSLKNSRQRVSNSINELQNTKNKETMTKEEKAEKIKKLKENLSLIENKISEQESNRLELEMQLENLNEEFPTLEMLQSKEAKVRSIYNTHSALKKTKKNIEEKQNQLNEITLRENILKSQISEISEDDIHFELSNYSDTQQDAFKRYKELQEALKFIEDHPNGGSIKLLINSAAKNQITSEISNIEKQSVIIDFNNYSRRENLKLQLSKIQEEKVSAQNSLEKLIQESEKYENIVSDMTEKEAVSQMDEYSHRIACLNEKQNYIKLSQTISTLKAEITLLNQTIKDLESRQAELDIL